MGENSTADLAETVRALRAQLAMAMSEGENESLRFDLGEVSMDFEVVVTRDVQADGGVRFGVISFGAKAGLAREATHRISLTMHPVIVDAQGNRTSALISGRSRQQPK